MHKNYSISQVNNQEYQIFLKSRATDESKFYGVGLTEGLEWIGKPLDPQEKNIYFLHQMDNKIPLGFCEFSTSKYNRTASFSQSIEPEYRDKNLGHILHSLAECHLFEELKVRRIVHHVLPENCKMTPIIESARFKYVGNARATSINITSPEDSNRLCLIYEKTAEDYRQQLEPMAASPRASYGINNPDFLEKEKERLNIQKAITYPSVSKALNSLNLERSDSLVDLGCGVGSITSLIEKEFPSKIVGIDIEGEFVKTANSLYANDRITFEQANLLEDDSIYADSNHFLLCLVAQHLGETNLSKMFEKFQLNAPRGAKLVLIDTADNLWSFYPALKGITSLFESAARRQEQSGGDRQIGMKIPAIGKRAGLKCDSISVDVFSSLTVPKETFFKVIDPLVHGLGDPEFLDEHSKNILTNQYEEWKTHEDAYAEGKLITTVFEK